MKCGHCGQIVSPKLTYETNQYNVTKIKEYRLEYCDTCYLYVHSNRFYKQMTRGKPLFLNISLALIKSGGCSLVILAVSWDYVLGNVTPHFKLISAATVFLGALAFLYSYFFDRSTRKEALKEIAERLDGINRETNNIVDVVERKNFEREEREWAEQERRKKEERERREQEQREQERIRREKEKRCGIEEIDTMDGVRFEERLKVLYQDLGYKVDTTPASGDQGVDLVLTKNNIRIAVQAKRYKKENNVGNSAIQEVFAGMRFYDCSEAWVVTTSNFTDKAIELAKKVNVRLISRKELIRLLVQQYEKYESKTTIRVTCSHCGALNNVDSSKKDSAVCGKCKQSLKSAVV